MLTYASLLVLLFASPIYCFLPQRHSSVYSRGTPQTYEFSIPSSRTNCRSNTNHQHITLRKRTTTLLHEADENKSVVIDDDSSSSSLDQFRSLMGNLYGVAGLAHAADCFFGNSQLLTAAASPPFADLPIEGKALAVLWCATGPIAFVASRKGGVTADIGLILYGLVEVFGAFLIKSTYATQLASTGDIDAFANAIGVQIIIVASWLYSSRKK